MIKASFEALHTSNRQSFLARKFDEWAYDSPYHFHPEYELTCITKGTGKRYMGSHMEDFVAGDLILLGPNLPHCWKLTNIEQMQNEAGAIVIQFTEDFLGSNFWERPELQDLSKLLKRSVTGIRFDGDTQSAANKSIIDLCNDENNFNKLLKFCSRATGNLFWSGSLTSGNLMARTIFTRNMS